MIESNTIKAFEMIDSLQGYKSFANIISNEVIDRVESVLGVKFPEDYRAFVNRYGSIVIDEICIYGISIPFDSEPSVVWALKEIRGRSENFPSNLIPIRYLSEQGTIVCIQCESSQSSIQNSIIIECSINADLSEFDIFKRNQNFTDYLSEILIETRCRRDSFDALEKHVKDFEREYLSIGKLPRNYVWRPYRFCSQDVILGLTVVRHSVDNNCLEVDVCLTSDVAEFEEGIGTKITTAFLLSEAYKCGGSMEIRFSRNVEGGRVPFAICRLADKYGVVLQNTTNGRISPSEAKLLYLAISEFSQPLKDGIIQLNHEGKLSIEKPCFTLYHGLWSRDQIEHIVLGSSYPDSILSGDSLPEQRHLYSYDLFHASAAVMGGILDRKLSKREYITENEALNIEDDIKNIDALFNQEYYAKMYFSYEEISIPWLKGNSERLIKPETEIVVLIRAYDSVDIIRFLNNDIRAAACLARNTGGNDKTTYVYILVPFDFEELPDDFQLDFINCADRNGVGILICPETSVSLGTEGAKKCPVVGL